MTDPSASTRRHFLKQLLRAGALAAVTVPGLPSRLWASQETSRAWRAMGTLIEVRVPDLPEAEAIEAIRGVRRTVENLEAAMTLFRPESPLVALNHRAESGWITVPESLASAVRLAGNAFEKTGGRFDPTVAPAMKAWGLFDLQGRVPSPRFFAEWRRRPRVEAIEVDAANRRIRRGDARVELDLGGIGKGIAVDAALDVLRGSGSRSALVNLGGSIGVLGAPDDSPEGWPVGIVDPHRPGSVWKVLHLASGHAATSGPAERFVATPQGKKHHLLDPVSGEPFEGPASVTAISPTGLEADIQSTYRFLSPDGVNNDTDTRYLVYDAS